MKETNFDLIFNLDLTAGHFNLRPSYKTWTLLFWEFYFFFLFQFPDIYIPKRDLLEVEEVETYALKNAETHRTEKYELVRNSQVCEYLLFV